MFNCTHLKYTFLYEMIKSVVLVFSAVVSYKTDKSAESRWIWDRLQSDIIGRGKYTLREQLGQDRDKLVFRRKWRI